MIILRLVAELHDDLAERNVALVFAADVQHVVVGQHVVKQEIGADTLLIE